MVPATASAMIDEAREQINDAGQRRAQHRWRQARGIPVEGEHRDRRRVRGSQRQTPGAAEEHEHRGQKRDVPAGYRDDVIRPRLLQPPLIVLIQTAAIANQDRRHDASRPDTPATDSIGGGRADIGAQRGRQLVVPRAAPDDRDEPRAFHAAQERHAVARQTIAIVSDPDIPVADRVAEGCAERDGPPLPPGASRR
jgi:hypothetical protein